jgi:hypothetical protein
MTDSSGVDVVHWTDDQPIGLAQTIAAVRRELNAAVSMKRDQEDIVGFVYNSVEIELELGITNDTEVEGGVKFWVISASAQGTRGEQTTHRIKVGLEPINVVTRERITGDVHSF